MQWKIQNPEICDTIVIQNSSDWWLRRNWLWEEVVPFADIDLDHALTEAQLSENEDCWGDGQCEGCSATLRRRWKS
jgi:hypothetical protein